MKESEKLYTVIRKTVKNLPCLMTSSKTEPANTRRLVKIRIFLKVFSTSLGNVTRTNSDYSIADLKEYRSLGHLSFSNLYDHRPVCGYCKAMYNKIDHLRVNSDNDANLYLRSKDQLRKQIKSYMEEREGRMISKMKTQTELKVYKPFES